jgi:xylulokinase
MLFLGFDSSTQSLTGQIIEVQGRSSRLVWESSLNFERDLPAYGTRHGISPSPDPKVAEAPPAMWAKALEIMMARVAASGLDLSKIAAVSGSAQQHGTVYLGDGGFTRERSPIWLDATTSVECAEITRALGGDDAVARLTGSRVFERFAGPQIRRFWKTHPDAYARTERIHLISSFLCSLLVDRDAPIDPGDGSGMSLMSLADRGWDPAALDATAPELLAKLPAIAAPHRVAGSLGDYWQRSFGFPPADVIVWTGDNSSSMVGTGVVEEGALAISLGTSDTIFGVMREPRVSPNGEGHVFGAPTGDFMGITVFANGSLARETVRDRYGMNWPLFRTALLSTPPGNDGALMIPWFVPEITPRTPRPRVRRKNLDEHDAARNVRALVEGQMMAMRNHSRWMGVNVSTIYATGGASRTSDVLQVMADVFNARVFPSPVGNSACLGAALRAWHGYEVARGHPIEWPAIVKDLTSPDPSTGLTPRAEAVSVYERLADAYQQFEREAV